MAACCSALFGLLLGIAFLFSSSAQPSSVIAVGSEDNPFSFIVALGFDSQELNSSSTDVDDFELSSSPAVFFKVTGANVVASTELQLIVENRNFYHSGLSPLQVSVRYSPDNDGKELRFSNGTAIQPFEAIVSDNMYIVPFLVVNNTDRVLTVYVMGCVSSHDQGNNALVSEVEYEMLDANYNDKTVAVNLSTGPLDSSFPMSTPPGARGYPSYSTAVLLCNDESGTVFRSTFYQRDFSIVGNFSLILDPESELNDEDGDGFYDHARIFFNAPILDSTFSTTGWSVAGFNITGFDTGRATNDSELRLVLQERTSQFPTGDTSVTTTVSYARLDGSAAITDVLGLFELQNSSVSAIDRARPVALEASSTFNSTVIRVRFSEPVGTSAAGSVASGNLTLSLFAYTNGNSAGAASLSSVTDGNASSDAIVELNVDAPFVLTDLKAPTADSLNFSSSIRDAQGNRMVASQLALTNSDKTAPTLVNATALALSNSTHIDTVQLYFSERMDFSGFNHAEFTVATRTITGHSIIDLQTVNLQLATLAEDYDTAVNSSVTLAYMGNSVMDQNENQLQAFSGHAILDGAAPVLLRANAEVDLDDLILVFSEPVFATSSGTGVPAPSAFVYSDGAAGGATGISAVLSASSNTLSARVNSNFLIKDFPTERDEVDDTINVAANSVFDEHGNAASGNEVSLTNLDTTPPQLQDAVAMDLDDDGMFDSILLIFDEPIDSAVLNQSLGGFNATVNGALRTLTNVRLKQSDDKVVIVSVAELGTVETDAAPTLFYDPSLLASSLDRLRDRNDNKVPFVHTNASDGTPPRLVSASMDDTDGNGKVDTVRLLFSETMAPGSFSSNVFSAHRSPGTTAMQFDSLSSDNRTAVYSLTELPGEGDGDTGTVFNVSHTKNAVTDERGSILDSFNVTVLDAARPRLLSARSMTNDTQIELKFSEAIQPLESIAALAYDNNEAGGATGLANVSSEGNVHFAYTNAPFNLSDFAGFGPSGGDALRGTEQLLDLAGNGGSNTGTVRVTNKDTTAPTLLRCESVDRNGDGKMDGALIVFSESMEGAGIVASLFSVLRMNGECPSPLSVEAAGSTEFLLHLQASSVVDTREAPHVNFSASASVYTRDINGNNLTSFVLAGCSDGMGPVLVNASGQVDQPQLTIELSEGVFSDANATSPIEAADLLLVRFNGSGANIVLSGFLGSTLNVSTLQATLSGRLLELSDFSASSGLVVKLAASSVFDARGNAGSTALNASLHNTDRSAPTIANVSILDRDGNGLMDGWRIVFSENVTDATVNAADFASAAGEEQPSGFITESLANDNVIVITRAESRSVRTVVSNATSLTYTRGSLTDRNNNSLDSISGLVVEDEAPPAILLVEGSIDSSAVNVTLSEPVSLVTQASAFAWAAGSGFSIQSVLEGNGSDSRVSFSLNRSIRFEDLRQARLQCVAAVGLEDGLTCASGAGVLLMSADTVAPVVVGAETQDLDGNGRVDAIKVLFNEALYSSSITASRDFWSVSGYVVTQAEAVSGSPEALRLRLVELEAFDGAAKPNISYNAPASGNSGILDLGANPLSSVNGVVAADRVLPRPVSASSVVRSNVVRVTFNEAVVNAAGGGNDLSAESFAIDANLSSLAFAIAGVAPRAGNFDPRVVELTLNASLQLAAFGAATIRIANSQIADSADGAAPLNASVTLLNSDNTPAVLLAAETGDLDVDGRVDALTLTVSEPLRAETVSANEFRVVGRTVLSAAVINNTEGAVRLRLSLAETSGAPDTGSTFNVSYNGSSLRDENDVAMLPSDSSLHAADAAAPVLLSVRGEVPLRTVTLTFSEPVDPGSVTAAGFNLTVASVQAATRSSGQPHVVVVNLSRALVRGDFVPLPSQLRLVAASPVRDEAGNAAILLGGESSIALVNSDSTPPTIVAARTRDQDANGRIDGIVIQFSKPVIDSSVVAGAWTTTSLGALVDSATGAAADDEMITLLLGSNASFPTNRTGTISYVPPASPLEGVIDHNGNRLVAVSSTAVADGAGPVIVRLETTAGIDFILVHFSEQVSSSSASAQPLQSTSFAYADANASIGVPRAVIGFASDAGGDGGDGVVELRLNATMDLDGMSSDSVQLAGGASVFDVAGNAAPAGGGIRVSMTDNPSLLQKEDTDSSISPAVIGGAVGGGVAGLVVIGVAIAVAVTYFKRKAARAATTKSTEMFVSPQAEPPRESAPLVKESSAETMAREPADTSLMPRNEALVSSQSEIQVMTAEQQH